MALKSRIEAELRGLSSANFQKLCDTYLRYNRDWPLQPWGAMLGADKDKTGIPDSYCQLLDSQYVMVAYTTAALNKLSGKLADDLTDCIKEAQAQLEANQVERIALVFNNVISLATTNKLAKKAEAKGYKLELISLSDIAEMVMIYPALAGELLNLYMGRGELMTGSDFVAAYGRQRLATPLNHTLYGRDAELQDFNNKLISNEVVLVTGPAGVGKTQLVVTACQTYCREDPKNRQVYYVYDKKSTDFSKELQFMLMPGKQVIIVADDANRVSPYLDVLIREQRVRPAGSLTIVATVRDYARDVVQVLVRAAVHAEVELAPLADEHITALLKAEPYGILNHRYLERILELSSGRPRLAIMVASAAKEAQNLTKLNNVADIYDLYFGPILYDLEASQNPYLLKVAALIYFFRVINQEDGPFARQIESAFGISPAVFWECTQLLHDAEIVEMYENRLVRTSDQVLGNYIFYQIFFSSRPALSYTDLLLAFFANWHRRAADTFVNVINDFNYAALKPKIVPALTTWLKQPLIESEARWLFFRTFWPYLRTEIISQAQDQLDCLSWPSMSIANYRVEVPTHNSRIHDSPILEALERLCIQPIDEQSSAIQLVIELIAKVPGQFNKGLQLLKTLCSFNAEEYDRFGLQTLNTTLDVLSATTLDAKQGDFARWLLQHIVPAALATSFQGSRSGRDAQSIVICNYKLPFQEDAKQWRKQLWNHFAELCTNNPLIINDMLTAYLVQRHHNMFASDPDSSMPQWRKWDIQYILPLLESSLDPANFRHCRLANQYYYWLKREEITPAIQRFKNRFTKAHYRLYELLVFNQSLGRRPNKSEHLARAKEPEKYFRKRLKPLAYKSLNSYKRIINQVLDIQPALNDNERQQAAASINIVLHEVMERQPELGIEVIDYWLSTSPSTPNAPWNAIKLLSEFDYQAGYKLISAHVYAARNTYKWHYLHHLPVQLASEFWLNELYKVVETGLDGYDFSGLSVYESLTKTLYPDLVTQAFNYAKSTTGGIYFDYELIKKYIKYFPGKQLRILKKLYVWLSDHEQHFDYEGEQLSFIVEQDPNFLISYSRRNSCKKGLWIHYDSRQLRFLWQSNNYHPQLLQVIEELAQKHTRFDEKEIADALFPVPNTLMTGLFDKSEAYYQDSFLNQCIIHFHKNPVAIQLLFSIIREQMPQKQIHYLGCLLPLVADNLDLMKSLNFFPLIRSAGHSWVPVHREDQELWRSVIRLIDAQSKRTPGLIKYRTIALEKISCLEKTIEQENERNFASPY